MQGMHWRMFKESSKNLVMDWWYMMLIALKKQSIILLDGVNNLRTSKQKNNSILIWRKQALFLKDMLPKNLGIHEVVLLILQLSNSEVKYMM